MTDWKAIIRFKSNGLSYWASIEPGKIPEQGTEVNGYRDIDPITIYQGTERVVVDELLAPLPSTTNPIVCIGVNYREHAEEAQLHVPSEPVTWYKPPTALADPNEKIPISAKAATSNFMDFEGELVIVTSRPAKNVSEDEAKDYILGFTVGNDLTLRLFQDPRRCGGQFTYAKAFDKFAPIGPSLLSYKAFTEKRRRIVTKVNGKVYQDSPIELIHSPQKLVSFLSQDTTLPAGTAIMTGTPKGVGWFQEPKLGLKDGDVVEVEVDDIGGLERPECSRCRNTKLQCAYPTSRRKPGPSKGSTPSGRMTALHSRIGIGNARTTQPKPKLMSSLGQLESLLKFHTPNPDFRGYDSNEVSNFVEGDVNPVPRGDAEFDNFDLLYSPDANPGSAPDLIDTTHIIPSDKVVTHQLLEIYFSTIQPMFPLFQRREFFQDLNKGSLPQDLIIVMMTLSQRVYSGSVDPGLLSSVARIEQNIDKKELYCNRIQLHDIKVACLCIIHQFASGPNRYTWMLMGKLARIVYGCKLHQVDKDDGAAHPYFPNTSLEELRYVWWTVIKIDHFSNVLAGTPCAIDATIAATSLPCTSVSDFTAGMEPDPSLKFIPRIRTDAFWAFVENANNAIAADGQQLQLSMCLLLLEMSRRLQVTLANAENEQSEEHLVDLQVEYVRICETLPAWVMDPQLATQHYETKIQHRSRLEALLQLRLCCLYSMTPSLLHLNGRRAVEPEAEGKLLQVWDKFISNLMAAVGIYQVMPASYYSVCDPMMSSGVWILACMLSICLMQQATVPTDLTSQPSPLRKHMETGFEALMGTMAGFAKMWPISRKLLASLESLRCWHNVPLDLGRAVELTERLHVPFPIHETAAPDTIYNFDILGTCRVSLDNSDLDLDLLQFWATE